MINFEDFYLFYLISRLIEYVYLVSAVFYFFTLATYSNRNPNAITIYFSFRSISNNKPTRCCVEASQLK